MLVIGDVLVGRENVLVELGEVQREAVQLVQHVQRAMFPRTARSGAETRRELYSTAAVLLIYSLGAQRFFAGRKCGLNPRNELTYINCAYSF